ncbi:homologous recombination OB-fold protein-like [Amphiura filiformis]|uniref:homologous recombination OB-fold protein-like n=1 Tax=Amphiura filiformis TaxID=82378 RepID=UPI003B2149A4
MKTELGSSAHSILSLYNIAIVLRKASLKQLPRKQVPNLCVMIRQITQTGFDACVMLKDPSGEMQGTLHRKIVEDYQADLKPGSVMVLRKVGVLSPTIRNHYLNITHSNLVQVYPPESASRSCSQTSPKSSGTHSRIRSPDSTDLEQSDFAITKGSNSSDLQHNSDHRNNHKSPPVSINDTGNKPGHPHAKVLLIEGVNTPKEVRDHLQTIGK